MRINDDGTMFIESSYVSKEKFRFFGRKIERKKDRLIIEDGWFSTCNKKEPHYKLTTKKIVVGPRAVSASNIALRIKDVPVLFLPWYSWPLKEREAPYSIKIGRSHNLGLFVRTKYYVKEGLGFLFDYYQKRGLGSGIEIPCWKAYYGSKRWLLSGYEKRGIASLKIDRQSDNMVSYDYFEKEIKEETKSYFVLEKAYGRIAFEENLFYDGGRWKKEFYPKGEFFISERPIGPFVFGFDFLGKKDDFTVNPRLLLGRLWTSRLNLSSRINFIGKDSDNYFILSTNLRFFPVKSLKQDITLEEKKGQRRLEFISETGIGRIETGYNLSLKKLEDIGFLLCLSKNSLSFSGEGRWRNNRLKSFINIGFEKPTYKMDILWLIKEKTKVVPSILLRPRDDISFKIAGHYEEDGEKRLDFYIRKRFHCVELDFSLNTKFDVGLDIKMR